MPVSLEIVLKGILVLIKKDLTSSRKVIMVQNSGMNGEFRQPKIILKFPKLFSC